MITVQQRITVNVTDKYKQLQKTDRKQLRNNILTATRWPRQYFYKKISGTWRILPHEFEVLKHQFSNFGITI
ncbi:MAG: hypothetical protein JXR39_11400 [Marinilabiliaceae bacterium]|nr:hypothetical protein [Marinilabiliaceae bacterium]